jgi:hypothetical protein
VRQATAGAAVSKHRGYDDVEIFNGALEREGRQIAAHLAKVRTGQLGNQVTERQAAKDKAEKEWRRDARKAARQ